MDIEKLEICGQRLEREQKENLARIPRFFGYFTVRGKNNFLEQLGLTTPRLIPGKFIPTTPFNFLSNVWPVKFLASVIVEFLTSLTGAVGQLFIKYLLSAGISNFDS
jgi:hypothetical protein